MKQDLSVHGTAGPPASRESDLSIASPGGLLSPPRVAGLWSRLRDSTQPFPPSDDWGYTVRQDGARVPTSPTSCRSPAAAGRHSIERRGGRRLDRRMGRHCGSCSRPLRRCEPYPPCTGSRAGVRRRRPGHSAPTRQRTTGALSRTACPSRTTRSAPTRPPVAGVTSSTASIQAVRSTASDLPDCGGAHAGPAARTPSRPDSRPRTRPWSPGPL